MEMVEVDQVQIHGAGNEAGEEDAMQELFVGRESGEVTVAFQDGRGRDVGKGSSQDAVGQSVDNVAVRA